jgi:hypothetical protein
MPRQRIRRQRGQCRAAGQLSAPCDPRHSGGSATDLSYFHSPQLALAELGDEVAEVSQPLRALFFCQENPGR